MFLSPKKFAEITGENYELILHLCKKGSIKCEKTDGGHFKVYKSELDKYTRYQENFITREEYEAILRENEMLKEKLRQIIKISMI